MGQALTMTGKLDAISFALGELKAMAGSLQDAISEGRGLADRRHAENKQRLENIAGRVGELENSVKSIDDVVATMKPVVEKIQITRWKIAGAVSLAFVILSALGWAAQLFAGKLVTWVASHLFK